MTRPYNQDLSAPLRFRIPADLLAQLDRRLKVRQGRDPNTTKSDLIREALAAYLGGASWPTASRAGLEAEAAAAAEMSKLADEQPPARFQAPHIIQPDGSCAGGCDADTDVLCAVSPTDPRRGRKKRR